MNNDTQNKYAAIIIILTLTVFFPTIRNGFTNWDDSFHLLNNHDITALSFQNISKMFSSYYVGHYIPLVIITFAVEYKFFGLDPFVFHFVSLFLHLITTVLIYTLVRQWKFNDHVAFLAALLFGIHPLHVEPVAWISARKDVLSGVFLIGSLILYYRFQEKKEEKYFLLSVSMYVFSLLAKVTGMFLPFFLFAQLAVNREMTNKKVLRLIPYWIVSAGFTLVMLIEHFTVTTVSYGERFSVVDKFCFASYNMLFYAVKSLVPIQLSAVYPYPVRLNGFLPIQFYAAAVVCLVVGLAAYRFRKKIGAYTAPALFFVFALLPTVQIVPFGSMIAADRFAYLALAGSLVIFISIIGKGIAHFDTTLKHTKIAAVFFVLIFSVITWNRISIWKNSEMLWNDAIAHYPDFPISYFSRGQYYFSQNDYQRALKDFDRAITLAPSYPDALMMRGYLSAIGGIAGNAKIDFTNVILLQPTLPAAYYNRGLLWMQEGVYDSAYVDFSNAILYDSTMAESYIQRASILHSKKRFLEAYNDFSSAIGIEPLYANAYAERGNTAVELKYFEQAMRDYRNAIRLDTAIKEVNVRIAKVFQSTGETDSAQYYLRKAEQAGVMIPEKIRREIMSKH